MLLESTPFYEQLSVDSFMIGLNLILQSDEAKRSQLFRALSYLRWFSILMDLSCFLRAIAVIGHNSNFSCTDLSLLSVAKKWLITDCFFTAPALEEQVASSPSIRWWNRWNPKRWWTCMGLLPRWEIKGILWCKLRYADRFWNMNDTS